MAKKKTARKVRTKAEFNFDIDNNSSKSAKNSTKKNLKRIGTGGIIAVVVMLIIGVVGGIFSFKYFTRNDCFDLIGKDELTLTLGETYIDESIHAVSFGRDVSDKVYIETNLQINQDGEYYADEIGTYYIVYKVKDFKYDKLFKIQRIRLIQYVEESEDILIDEVGGV